MHQVHDFETEGNPGSAPPTPNGEGDSPVFTTADPTPSMAAERAAQQRSTPATAAVIDAQAVPTGPPAEARRSAYHALLCLPWLDLDLRPALARAHPPGHVLPRTLRLLRLLHLLHLHP